MGGEFVETSKFKTLSKDDALEINGGFDPMSLLAGVATVWVCYEAGYAVGKAIAHITSKKKK